MAEQCKFPLCKRVAESNGYCIGHRIYASSAVTATVAKPVEKRSSRMKKVMQELGKLYAIYLAKDKNKECKIQIDENCQRIATVVHHVRGREGDQAFVQKDWKPSCAYCNNKLEEKDSLARKKGVKKSKFQTKHKNRSVSKK